MFTAFKIGFGATAGIIAAVTTVGGLAIVITKAILGDEMAEAYKQAKREERAAGAATR